MKTKRERRIAMLLAALMLIINLGISPVWAAPGDVAINEANFPDKKFRKYVSTNFDTVKDGTLSQEELDAVTEINVTEKGISNLKGVEHFTKLKKLNCYNNKLTALDISKNKNLELLSCGLNKLTALDLKNNTKLESLGCSVNRLNSLDVTKNTKLKKLYCNDNPLGALNVSKNTELTKIYCSVNQLTTLDLSHNTKLTYLDCNQNKLTNLDLSHNTNLEVLRCQGNQLEALDLTKNTKLRNLYCFINKLAALDLSENTELTLIECQQNQLTTLDLSKNTKLTYIECQQNQLTNLDLSKNSRVNNFIGFGQVYDIKVDKSTLKFNLKSLPGNFDPSKASDWDGGDASGNTLTLDDSEQSYVTYKYDTGHGILNVKLNVKYGDVVTVTFNKNGYGGEPATIVKTIDKYSKVAKPSDPTDEQYDFGGWYTEAECTNAFDFTQAVNDNITLYAKWTEKTPPAPTQFTITFEANGHGTAPADIIVNKGETATAPDAPTDANYDFGGWYTEAECTNKFDFSQAVNDNITLYAKWTKKTPPTPVTVTITFNANGHGTAPEAITVNKGEQATAPTAPTDANYDFGGWYTEAECTNAFDFTQAVNDNITLYAKWTEKTPPAPTQFTITFEANGHGTAPADIIVNKGETATAPDAPTDANYDFGGWYTEAECTNAFDFSQAVNDNITLYAKWTEKTPPAPTQFTITFEANGGGGTMPVVTKNKDEKYALPDCGFTPPTDKEFKAWQVGGVEKNIGDEITVDGDKTVTAVWKDKGSVPPTPPTPPTPTPEPTPSPYPYPLPWIIYPSWYYAYETPEPKEEPVKIDRKIVLTIGTNFIDRGLNGISTDIIMDVAPYIKEGRTMLPVRYVAEGLGFDVEWIESTRTVVLLDGTTKVEIPVDTDKIIVNGTVYTGDVKPEIKKGRTMLSIANIARALGLQDGKDIIWNDKSKTVTIYRTILVK